ncbi:MAG TPA: hypothetical protein VFC44_08495 [Candidatus Saccharimonadales bacterium]|nr:hypothetical protein [Candidatus Saccharimonadales bacterium]
MTAFVDLVFGYYWLDWAGFPLVAEAKNLGQKDLNQNFFAPIFLPVIPMFRRMQFSSALFCELRAIAFSDTLSSP